LQAVELHVRLKSLLLLRAIVIMVALLRQLALLVVQTTLVGSAWVTVRNQWFDDRIVRFTFIWALRRIIRRIVVDVVETCRCKYTQVKCNEQRVPSGGCASCSMEGAFWLLAGTICQHESGLQGATAASALRCQLIEKWRHLL
jgi:hypothetical protein